MMLNIFHLQIQIIKIVLLCIVKLTHTIITTNQIHIALFLPLVRLIICDHEKDIGPNNNLYSNILMSCKYYTEQQLHFDIQLAKAMGISIIHFNA